MNTSVLFSVWPPAARISELPIYFPDNSRLFQRTQLWLVSLTTSKATVVLLSAKVQIFLVFFAPLFVLCNLLKWESLQVYSFVSPCILQLVLARIRLFVFFIWVFQITVNVLFSGQSVLCINNDSSQRNFSTSYSCRDSSLCLTFVSNLFPNGSPSSFIPVRSCISFLFI